jgi:hypothetical protein
LTEKQKIRTEIDRNYGNELINTIFLNGMNQDQRS